MAKLAVHSRLDREFVNGVELVRGYDPRTDRAAAIEVLSLGDIELRVPHPVADGALVHQREACDVGKRLLSRDAPAALADHNYDLAFIVELLALLRADEWGAVGRERGRRANEKARVFRRLGSVA